MDNELMILIRKQLTQSTPKYKRIGIIGAVTVATTVARHSVNQSEGDFSSDLLELAAKSCQRSQVGFRSKMNY